MRFSSWLHKVFLFGLAACWPVSLVADAPEINWQKIGDDLELATVSFPQTPLLNTEITFLRSSLRRYRIGVLSTKEFGRGPRSVKSLCKMGNAVACINANYFDEQGAPLGLVVHRGIQHQPIHKGGSTLTGIFYVARNSIEIANRVDHKSGLYVEAVQAGPRLVVGGKPAPGLRDATVRSRRSGICLDDRDRFIMYVVSRGLIGISLKDLQSLLLNARLGCIDALNLDGGGSSQLFLTADVPGAPQGWRGLDIGGVDEIPVALGLLPRSAGH